MDFTGGAYPTLAAAQTAGAATLNYGLFINAIINFIIVAFAVFLLVKQMNKLQKKQEEGAKEALVPPADVKLLIEIRDLLAKEERIRHE